MFECMWQSMTGHHASWDIADALRAQAIFGALAPDDELPREEHSLISVWLQTLHSKILHCDSLVVESLRH